MIGCGQIAEAHLREIALRHEAELVAVCDKVEVLAQDAAERFGAARAFTDVDALLAEAKPDVVHITTPPHTHVPVGLKVIERGCHAYIEKPFGVDRTEAQRLIEAAQAKGVLVCAGFSQVGDVAVRKFTDFVGKGRLGDALHAESFYGTAIDGSFLGLYVQGEDIAQSDPDTQHVTAALSANAPLATVWRCASRATSIE